VIVRRAAFVAVLSGVLVVADVAGAQDSTRVQPEVRADAILSDRQVVQGGVGLNIPAGFYARIGVVVAGGADIERGFAVTAGRVDVLARFLLDPFRQARWGLSVGGGVSLRAREGDRVRPYLLTLVDLEGPRIRAGWAPALQVGLGGGVRIGLGIRRGAERFR
jgi:hypothetical protein